MIRSLIVPGWGQVYNRRWWKVPVIYAGIGLLGSAVIFNQQRYNEMLAIANHRKFDTAPKPGDKYYKVYEEFRPANDAVVHNYLDNYRRNRDLSILGIFGAWGIQMIDAYIDAKFRRSYTMDNDLSFIIRPGVINSDPYGQALSYAAVPGLKISMEF
ncbi:MAG: hypothetical protein EOP47_24955 [Sphingobacteriaceae bacterium]|nr:MAG: hypothetical protein EOP47_24955 [Sphingobacteriaceae bacterium]